MKKDKKIIIVLLAVSIILPFVVYSIIFPNIYVIGNLDYTDNANDFTQELEEKLPN